MELGKGSTSANDVKNDELKVLVVDDDPLIRKIHKMLLTKFKVESEAVENGREATNRFLSGASFDLVLMDMEMPVMDGPTATKELRDMGVTSMIIGVTSRDMKWEHQVFKEAGADDCYVKPLNMEKLASIFQNLNTKY